MNSVFPGRTILLSIIGSTLLLYSCRSNQAEQLPVKGDALKGLNISEVKDQIALNLDDLFDSILFIPLETNKQVVLNGYRSEVLINDDYIVVIEETAVILFDKQGQFVKKILTRGRGPKEFNSLRNIHSQSNKQIVLEISAYAFIQEMGRQSLNHTGKYGKQLLDLMETMREDDNPLLIVGRIPAPVEIY